MHRTDIEKEAPDLTVRAEPSGVTGRKEHILVCLSSSPSNARIITAAAEMARGFGASLTALYVKTPHADKMSRVNRERLAAHIRLAQKSGADIASVYGEDISYQITEFARISNVTRIVLGRSHAIGHSLGSFFEGWIYGFRTLTDRLIKAAPELEIHIIPDSEARHKPRLGLSSSGVAIPEAKSWLIALFCLLISTGVGYLFHLLEFTDANTITVYILGALLTALFTRNYICSGLFSLASVFLFNFLFTEPRLSLIAYESGYPATLAIMFTASIITGTLANKLASNARQSAEAAYRTQIMLDTAQLLQKADGEDEVISVIAGQLRKLLSRNIVFYPVSSDELGEPRVFPVRENDDCRSMLTPQELAAAKWVLANKKRAGAGTDRLSDALCMYLAVRSGEDIFCIVSIRIGSKSIEPFENSILLSILGECALAMESIRSTREKEQIALLAKNEQLRANLLRSISHDLRTPLTSISGNTENLLSNYDAIDPETRRTLLTDMYNDSQWLIMLVENLLSITRISEGRMNIELSPQLCDEVISESLRHIGRKGEGYIINTELADELLLADMDIRLISQVIINLVDNAIKYTPRGSTIVVGARAEGDFVRFSVADNGDGIPDAQKSEVFRMFYTGENRIADCRRSLGLGLSLCESIINAHGGTIGVGDNSPHGCVFTFTLKRSEVTLNE